MQGLFWLYALAYQPASASAQPPAAARSTAAADDDSLPAERLRQLKERIKEGFYRQPEVLDEIARPLTDDIIDANPDRSSTPPAPEDASEQPSE